MALTGDLIKRLRIEAGLTQKELAETVGFSQAHIAKIEQEKVDPRLSTVNKILGVLRAGKERRCKDIMTEGVLFAKPNDSVLHASEVMVHKAVSQLPVLVGRRIVGTVTEESIIRNLRSNLGEEKVKSIMDPPLPSVSEETNVDFVRALLQHSSGVLVTREKEVVGILTRSDLLKTIS